MESIGKFNEALSKIDNMNVDLNSLSTYELWEIESALYNSVDDKAKDALAKFKSRINEAEYQKRSKELAEQIERNQKALDILNKEYHPFTDAKDPDVVMANNFFDNVVIANQSGVDKVEKESFKADLLAVTNHQTRLEIAKKAGFAELDNAGQKQAYKTTFFTCLQTNIINHVENQLLQNEFVKAEGNAKYQPDVKDIKKVAEEKVKGLFDNANGKIKFPLTNINIIGTIAGKMADVEDTVKLIASKAKLAGDKAVQAALEAKKEIQHTDKEIEKKYPTLWPLAKGFFMGATVMLTTGPLGMAAYGGLGLYKTIENQRLQATKEGVSYGQFLKKNKGQAVVFGAGIAGVTFVGASVVNAAVQGGITATMGLVGGNTQMFTNMASHFKIDGSIGEKAASFFGSTWKSVTSTGYLARIATSAFAAGAVAGEDFVKAKSAKTDAERKLLHKKAYSALTRTGLGFLTGFALAGMMGADQSQHIKAGPDGLDMPGDNNHQPAPTPAPEVVAEKPHFTHDNYHPVHVNGHELSLDAMDHRSDQIWGADKVDQWYKALESGQVESFDPSVMSKEEFVFRVTQLSQFSWGVDSHGNPVNTVHSESLKLIFRDLDCNGTILTQTDVDKIHASLSTIDTVKGDYHGYEPTARTCNVTKHISVNVDCDEKTMTSTHDYTKGNCGSAKVNIVVENTPPAQETPVVRTAAPDPIPGKTPHLDVTKPTVNVEAPQPIKVPCPPCPPEVQHTPEPQPTTETESTKLREHFHGEKGNEKFDRRDHYSNLTFTNEQTGATSEGTLYQDEKGNLYRGTKTETDTFQHIMEDNKSSESFHGKGAEYASQQNARIEAQLAKDGYTKVNGIWVAPGEQPVEFKAEKLNMDDKGRLFTTKTFTKGGR